MADCPHPELFFYGKATGSSNLRLDVMTRYYGIAHGLQVQFSRNPEGFRDIYLRWAQESGMIKYMTNTDGSSIEQTP